MRFHSEQHIRRQSDFRLLRQQGQRINCGLFTLWFLLRHDENPKLRRVGVVASIAAVGNAVQRNLAKRRLRELFRHHQELLPLGSDLLLVARAAVSRQPFPVLEAKFTESCRKLTTLPMPEIKPKLLALIVGFPAWVLLGLVRVYQRIISPVLPAIFGPACGCRFTPTCSHYASDALRIHGAMKGSWLVLQRLLKCTPLHPGGADPVPPSPRHPRPSCTAVNSSSPTPQSLFHG